MQVTTPNRSIQVKCSFWLQFLHCLWQKSDKAEIRPSPGGFGLAKVDVAPTFALSHGAKLSDQPRHAVMLGLYELSQRLAERL